MNYNEGLSDLLLLKTFKIGTFCSYPRIYDEVLYSTYASNVTSYWDSRDFPTRRGSLVSEGETNPQNPAYLAQHFMSNEVAKAVASDIPFGEVFIFEYGVIVIWGLREEEEHAILRSIRDFGSDPIPEEEIETEHLRFKHDFSMPARICNDIIYLKSGNPLVKLTISHAIAQSVKLTLFENRIDNTINTTKHVPVVLAQTGDVHMSR